MNNLLQNLFITGLGIINGQGKIVVPCKFYFTPSFVNRRAYVGKKRLFGTNKLNSVGV